MNAPTPAPGVADTLPTLQDVANRCGAAQALSALDRFVLHHEPRVKGGELWRRQLAAAMSEALAAIPGKPVNHVLDRDFEECATDPADFAAQDIMQPGQVEKAWQIYAGEPVWIACWEGADGTQVSEAFPTEEAARAAITLATEARDG